MTIRYIAFWIPGNADDPSHGVRELHEGETIEIKGIGPVSMRRDELGFYIPIFPLFGRSILKDPYKMHRLGVMSQVRYAGLFDNKEDAQMAIFNEIQGQIAVSLGVENTPEAIEDEFNRRQMENLENWDGYFQS